MPGLSWSRLSPGSIHHCTREDLGTRLSHRAGGLICGAMAVCVLALKTHINLCPRASCRPQPPIMKISFSKIPPRSVVKALRAGPDSVTKPGSERAVGGTEEGWRYQDFQQSRAPAPKAQP